MKEEKEQYKTRPFEELSTLELHIIFRSLVALKYSGALDLADFYRKYLMPGGGAYDHHAEYVQKANFELADRDGDFFSEIVRAINTREENGDYGQ